MWFVEEVNEVLADDVAPHDTLAMWRHMFEATRRRGCQPSECAQCQSFPRHRLCRWCPCESSPRGTRGSRRRSGQIGCFIECSARSRTRSLSSRARSTCSISSRIRSDHEGSRVPMSAERNSKSPAHLPRQQSPIEINGRTSAVPYRQLVNNLHEAANRIRNLRLKGCVFSPD